MSSTLPAHLTLDDLAQCATPLPDVEVHGLDMGWYIVRLHQGSAVSLLIDEHGETQRFTGTHWIGRALAPMVFTWRSTQPVYKLNRASRREFAILLP